MIRRVDKLVNDKLVGYTMFFILILYIIIYGIFVTRGFVTDIYSLQYFTILPLIFGVDGIKNFSESLLPHKHFIQKEDILKISVVIPSKNGEDTLELVLKDLLQRFPRNHIIVSSNGSTDSTCDIARKYDVKLVETKQAIGKVEAINVALSEVRTRYTLIIDDDTLIGKDTILPTNLLDEGFDGVAFVVVPEINNWLTKIQNYEYRKSMQVGKFFHNNNATVQNISGAIGLFYTKELIRQKNLHTGEFSGEDLQRTLLIHLYKNRKGVVISSSIVRTFVPNTIISLFNQRILGWYPGFYANFLLFLRLILKRQIPMPLKYDAFYNLILVTILDLFRFLAFPIIIFFPGYFVVMYTFYVAIETITYFRLKDHGPYWIILIYPIYGLFGFITRVCAFFVFIYRRSIVFLKNAMKLDDYRKANLLLKVLVYFFTIELGTLAPILYLYIKIVYPQS